MEEAAERGATIEGDKFNPRDFIVSYGSRSKLKPKDGVVITDEDRELFEERLMSLGIYDVLEETLEAIESTEAAVVEPVQIVTVEVPVAVERQIEKADLGDFISGFETIEKIGEGSSAIVSHVRQESIGADYALHRPKPEHFPQNLNRLRRKAERIAMLQREFPDSFPRVIADMTKTGENAGVLYEFVPGDFLETVRGEELKDRVGYFIQFAKNVGVMHSKGLVGLDVKPSMARVDAKKKVKGVDVEASYRVEFDARQSLVVQSMDLTTTLTSPLGTLGYLAPEQHSASEEIDERADIFGLGKVLYEVVRGKPAVSGLPSRTSEFDSAEGKKLYEIVLRAIDSERDQRFANVDEMIQAVKEVFPEAKPAESKQEAKETTQSESGKEQIIPERLLDFVVNREGTRRNTTAIFYQEGHIYLRDGKETVASVHLSLNGDKIEVRGNGSVASELVSDIRRQYGDEVLGKVREVKKEVKTEVKKETVKEQPREKPSELEVKANDVEVGFGDVAGESLNLAGKIAKGVAKVAYEIAKGTAKVAYGIAHFFPGCAFAVPTMIRKGYEADKLNTEGPLGAASVGSIIATVATPLAVGHWCPEYLPATLGAMAVSNAISGGYEIVRKGMKNAREKKAKELPKGGRIRKVGPGRTEMDFTHQGKVLTAVHPFYGPSDSLSLQRKIRGAGLVESTAPEVVSFVHEYFDRKHPPAEEVRGIIKNNYFRCFTGILYDPETKLVSFVPRLIFNDGSAIDTSNLVQRVNAGDFQTRVPFDSVREGLVSWQDVAKHPYLIAWTGGQEGAEKLAELASKHPTKAVYLWVPNISNLSEPIARVAALDSSWDGVRLGVNGNDSGSEGSYAFGMLPK